MNPTLIAKSTSAMVIMVEVTEVSSMLDHEYMNPMCKMPIAFRNSH